ncbi:unnamed protein product [Penicillium bialowiezense]
MDCLPNEILEQICLNLEGPDYCPPKDLSSFSQVNHACNRAAVPILYRNITLIFKTSQGLEAELSKVTEASRASLFTRFARRLSVVCVSLHPDSESQQAQAWEREPWAISLSTDRKPATRKGFLEYDMTSCDMTTPRYMFYRELKGLRKPEKWAPVVSLIADLNHLEEFDFFTSDDLTSDLMEVVSRNHPHCKINLFGAQEVELSSRYQDSTTMAELKNNWYMQLLHLSGLHTIDTGFPISYKPFGEYDRLDDMLPFLFSSPGLKHLVLEPASWGDDLPAELQELAWQSLHDTIKPKAVSQLESVTIPSLWWPGASMLSKLAAAGDLSQLRTLDIGFIIEPEKLVIIARLFPNLKRLFFGLVTRNSGTSTINSGEDIAGIQAFHPLEYLSIKGLRNVEDLDRIVQHHGLSLKGLALEPTNYNYPTLNPSKLLEIATRCPNLEELRIHMKRSLGDQTECEMYKALGTFPNLRRLFLGLDFDARPKVPGSGNKQETEDVDALRQTFINAAMDQSLALQIWSMIRSKDSRLKDLRILPFGNQHFSEEESYLLNCFARSYLLTGYNIENPGVPVIEQIWKRAREVYRAWKDSRGNGILDQEHVLSKRAVSVLRSIWPQVTEQVLRSDWRDCWTSMPLQPAMSPGEFSEA